MKKSLLVTIIGFVLAALAAIDAPQPLASPVALAQAECDCSNLKVLQIELSNAIRLQQAFRNFSRTPELRRETVTTSKNMLKIFAGGEARRGLETVPNYNGPKEYDYVSWGETQDIDYISKSKTMEEICDFSASSNDLLKAAKEASACAGIGAALQAHENWHRNFCVRIGYRPYLTMHGADRAQEEVEAYGVEIAMLRAEIARVSKKNWTGTITYTLTDSYISKHNVIPGKGPMTITEGGHSNTETRKTYTGTITVNGNEGVASVSAEDSSQIDESIYGQVWCSPLQGFKGTRGQSSSGYTASGTGEGKASVSIIFEPTKYGIEISVPGVNAIYSHTSQGSASNDCKNNKPTNDSSGYSKAGTIGSPGLLTAAGSYGRDREVLKDTATKNILNNSSTSPDGSTTSTHTIVQTITWNLRRCD